MAFAFANILMLSAFGSITTYGQSFTRHAYAGGVWPHDMISYEETSERAEGLEVSGRIPVLTEEAGQVGERVNELIDQAVSAKIASARESRSRSLNFDFEVYFSNPNVSVLIKSTTTGAAAKTEVTSINFNTSSGSRLCAADVVGEHIVRLADQLLIEMIRRNPERYNPSFTGIRREQAFSVTDREIVFWFDEFQLTSNSGGIVPLRLRRADISTVRLTSDQYHTRLGFNLKMIPVGTVLRGLNYSVSANSDVSKVSVFYDSELVIELRVGANNYVRGDRLIRSLETAPVHVGSYVYVPISFFDQILDFVAFSVDSSGTIIFATYSVTDAWFDR